MVIPYKKGKQMSIKQLQRVALDKDYRPYARKEIKFVTAPAKPGAGYYLAIATMMTIVFAVAYSLF
jgi:hypothetical protein